MSDVPEAQLDKVSMIAVVTFNIRGSHRITITLVH